MPYEIWWAVVIVAWILGALGLATLRAHLLAKKRLRLRELVHAERMAALERGVSAIELPDLDHEIAALETGRAQRVFRRPLLGWGVVLVAAGAGVCLGFRLSGEDNLAQTWSLGLIGILVGAGLLLTHRLDGA